MAEHDAHYLIIGSEQYNFRDDTKLPAASPSATGDLTVEGDIYFNEEADPLSTQLSGKANTADLANVATSGEAEDVSYDNSNSGLVAEDVQAAVDEVVTDLSDKMDKLDPVGTGSLSMNRKANTTVGLNSTTEGTNNTASDDNAHAEGYLTVASGSEGHAEGTLTTASGGASHAEGSNTVASGLWSHVEGLCTEAAGDAQHVSGKYNEIDNNDTYAEIIGNGTSENNRKNARTLDWSGNETIAGDLYFNGGVNPLSTQLTAKQDALTAGTNITIAGSTISATDTKPTDYDTSGDKTDNVATSATWSILSSVAITKGKWIVNFGANFPSLGSGNTGHCGVGVSDVSTPSTRPPVEACLTAQRITNDNYTTLSSSFLYDCTVSSKTLYLKVRQTSGQTLSVEGKLRVIKIL